MTIRTVLLQLFLTLGMPIALSAQNVIPDPTFGDAGTVSIPAPSFSYQGYHHLLPDGRIVVIGTMDNPDVDQTDVYVARFLADGAFDASFGDGEGFVFVPGTPDRSSDLYANTVDKNGKIILAINEYDFDVDQTRIVRLNADGTPDGTFGTAGVVTVDLATGDLEEYLSDVVVLPDGKLFFGGYIDNGQGIYVSHFVRLNDNGTFDSTYDTDGRFSMPVIGAIQGAVVAMELLPDKKIAVAGIGFNAAFKSIPYTARLGTDGKPDPAFGTNGRIVYNDLPFDINFLYDILVQNNGQWLIGGSSAEDGAGYNEDHLLFRFNSDGSLDQGFAGTGYFKYDLGQYETIEKIAVTADNRPMIAGYSGFEDPITQSFSAQHVLGRLTESGLPDPAFNGGFILGDTLEDAGAFGVSVQPDGKTLVSGFVDDGNQSGLFITRFSEVSGLHKLRPVLEEVTLFPNPAADHTNLRFTLDRSTVFGVQLVNAEGKSIAALSTFRAWTAGEHQIRLGLPAGLPAGNYRVVVQGNDGVQSIPVTIR